MGTSRKEIFHSSFFIYHLTFASNQIVLLEWRLLASKRNGKWRMEVFFSWPFTVLLNW